MQVYHNPQKRRLLSTASSRHLGVLGVQHRYGRRVTSQLDLSQECTYL